jgi:S-formylglutathione hydrolase FrmB
MYIDNAAIDFVGANLELFSSRLSARGIPHTYIINPVGDHNDEYWSSHVNEYLAFYGRDWARDAADLPGCG